jgi:hypothetical protein
LAKAEIPSIFPNFAEGWNGKLDPTDLPANAFSGKNLIPSKSFKGSVEKVRLRRQDLLSVSADSQDDRLLTPVNDGGLAQWTRPNFDPIQDVFFQYSNSWSMTTPGAAAAPTGFALWHGTPANARCKFGIRLEKEVKITTTKSLIVAIRLSRVAGSFSSAAMKLTAKLYPAQTTSSKPGALSGLTNPTYQKEVIAGTYHWAEFHFLASSSDVYLSAGEYFVELTDTSTNGSTVNAHYIIALSDTASDPNGYAVCVNNAGTTTQPLADCIVFQRKGTNASGTAQDAATVSTVIATRTLRDVNISNTLGTEATTESFERATEAYFLSDRFGIYMISDSYGPLVDRVGISSVHVWDGQFYNHTSDQVAVSAPTPIPKFFGRIEAWTTYQRKLIMGGIGGIAILDPTDTAFSVSSGTGDVAVPNIQNRTSTVDYEWLTTYSKSADVYPPVVTNVFTAGINPGRIFATINDEIIWSGGTTAATNSVATTWSAFATIQFGDTRDKILKACWWRGYIFLFTQNGGLYYITGEPPIDPTQGYGTLRADYIAPVGQCTTVEVTRDGVWFATEEGKRLYFLDQSFVPKRVDSDLAPSIKVNNIFWDSVKDRVWVASERHAKRSYLTTSTNDGTLATEYVEACSYLLDENKWYYVQRNLDTDTTANRPDTLIYGPLAIKCGAYVEYRKTVGTYTYSVFTVTPTFTTGAIGNVAIGDLFYESDNDLYGVVSSVGASTFVQANNARTGNDFYTIKRTPYLYLDFADGFLDIYNTSANSADPENSDYRAVSCTADLYTKEIDFSEATGLIAAMGQIKDAFVSGYFQTGTTATIYAVEQDGTETLIATITGDQGFASPATQTYREMAGPVNPSNSFRLRISISGKNKDLIRSAGFSSIVRGQKGIT